MQKGLIICQKGIFNHFCPGSGQSFATYPRKRSLFFIDAFVGSSWEMERPWVHRLFPVIHLPGAGDSLFSLATAPANCVIYTIIAAYMKTSYISTANTASHTGMRLQALMVVAGIMTAVICTLVLLKDGNALQLMPF